MSPARRWRLIAGGSSARASLCRRRRFAAASSLYAYNNTATCFALLYSLFFGFYNRSLLRRFLDVDRQAVRNSSFRESL